MLAYTFYENDNRVRRYAEALVRRGDEVDAIVLGREGQVAKEVVCGVNVFRIQTRVLNEKGKIEYLFRLVRFFFKSAWTITVMHLKNRYDVIHVHSVPDFEVFATAAPRLFGAKVILDIHDIVPEFYISKFRSSPSSVAFKLLLLVEKVSNSYADHVIIANDLWYEKLVHRSVPSSKCSVILNYPDLSIFRRSVESCPHETFTMFYPGTLNRHQGLDLVIDAISSLKERKLPKFHVLIVGEGPERINLERAIEALSLGDHITLKGAVPMESVAEILKSVDLGIVPKRADDFANEAFSTKILEFMAMDVPVLVSDTKIDQYYFKQWMVEFFQAGNATDLAEKISNLIQSPERLAELRAGGREFIAENNWGKKAEEYFKLVDRLSNAS